MTLVLGMLLDALFGEPRALWSRLPHPAVLMGRAVSWVDQRFNHGGQRKLAGALAMAGLVLISGGLGAVLAELGPVFEVAVLAILLAQKSLVQHVRAVADALRLSLGDGRRAVAMIVGRDTSEMDSAAASRAAIESAAENLSDGVVAPVFWFAVAGLPGLLIYKITNTADSMIGYKTERHAEFGWAAARFDDLLNLIPARMTTAVIFLVSGRLSTGTGLMAQWRDIRADAALHRSPNAGWPEAAMARALNVALSGPRSYDGTLQDFAWVHPTGNRTPGPDDIDRAIGMLWRTWAALFALASCAALLG